MALAFSLRNYYPCADEPAGQRWLLCTALLILGYGIYELVISDIDARHAMAAERPSNLLNVDSLESLKQKLTNVIVVALIVAAFKTMISFNISSWLIGRSHTSY